ncbi:MAG: hypothetical protein J0L64_04770 [Acidobacteria bacterium]|nr:hypothetical protein [Acidobacteriota bacterium]
MLHQQCWCWGQDIRRAEGNLLLHFGLNRTRPPELGRGSSRYEWRDGGTGIVLWGFGIALRDGQCGGIYVNRYCFVPRWLPQQFSLDEIWRAEQMENHRGPSTRREIRRSRRLLKTLVGWIASYERWVRTGCGVEYRRRTLAEWTRTDIPADQMALRWEQLGRHVEEPPPEVPAHSVRPQPGALLSRAAWHSAAHHAAPAVAK